jgi:hypothetical protein
MWMAMWDGHVATGASPVPARAKLDRNLPKRRHQLADDFSSRNPPIASGGLAHPFLPTT